MIWAVPLRLVMVSVPMGNHAARSVDPSGGVAAFGGRADEIVGDASKHTVAIVVKEPVNSDISCQKQIEKPVIVIVRPRGFLRVACPGTNKASDGIGWHPRERAATVVPIENGLVGIFIN